LGKDVNSNTGDGKGKKEKRQKSRVESDTRYQMANGRGKKSSSEFSKLRFCLMYKFLVLKNNFFS
jgi:hypothetical protein